MVLAMGWVLATLMVKKRVGRMAKTRSLFRESYRQKTKGKIRKKVIQSLGIRGVCLTYTNASHMVPRLDHSECIPVKMIRI